MRFCSAFLASALGAAIVSATCFPTASQAIEAEATGQCELHVWPSSGLRSVYYGWLHGGIVDGAVNGRDGYPPIPKDPVPTTLQVELLSKLDLAGVLQLEGYRVVVHDQSLDSRTIRAATGRLATSTSSCYAELIGDDVFFQQDVFSGAYLKSLIRFRSFGPGNAPARTFGTWTETRLQIFPPKEETQNVAALAELHGAFVKNIESFGAFLNKPAKKKKS